MYKRQPLYALLCNDSEGDPASEGGNCRAVDDSTSQGGHSPAEGDSSASEGHASGCGNVAALHYAGASHRAPPRPVLHLLQYDCSTDATSGSVQWPVSLLSVLCEPVLCEPAPLLVLVPHLGSRLQQLHLARAGLTQGEGPLLARLLRAAPHLSQLALQDNALCFGGVFAVLEAAAQRTRLGCSTLRELDVRDNGLSEPEVQSVFQLAAELDQLLV